MSAARTTQSSVLAAGQLGRALQELQRIVAHANRPLLLAAELLGHVHLTDDPDAMLHFNFWLSTRELPAGMRRPKVTLHLELNGKEIAASRSPVVPDYMDWYFYERKELIMETRPKQKWLNLTDVTKQDGELVMIVKAEGQPIKSYKTRITGGKLQSLERSRLGFEPRTDFISPRYVDLTDRSRSDFTMRDMFWVRKSR